MTIIETILLRAFLNFILLGSVAGLIAGAVLILRPHWLERVSLLTNRWISTRKLDRKLESSITLDPWFYRYRWFGGAFILLGALYILYFFTVRLDKAAAIAGLAKRFHVPIAYVGALFDPLVLIALLGATFAMFVSLFVLFRPSLLRQFEHGANQWVSLRRALKPLEVSRGSVDEFAFLHTRQMGVLLVLGSIYTLVLLTFWAR
ncbi:MAG: hypothetical protein EPO42_06990 [Gallionellaceae bacterium]|nr:MAG: hypothetical protein EPO42_06990 [Gallionellaceae bacterium]